MQFSQILSAIAAASLINTATAACFKTGATWADAGGKDKAKGALVPACNFFRGTWKKDEVYKQCSEPSPGKRFDFEIKYVGGGGYRELSQRECEVGVLSDRIASSP